MADQGFERLKRTLMVGAGLVALWGLAGLADVLNVPYSGYDTDGNNTVIRVRPGSPAEAGGLMVGDYIRSIDGTPVEDSRTLARRPRPEIGETRTLAVERGGMEMAATPDAVETANVEITYSGLSGRFMVLSLVSLVIGACFLIFGLIAYNRSMNLPGTLLASLGVVWGLAFLPNPYFTAFALRAITGAITVVIILLGFAFLLHLLLAFPKRKALLEKKNATMAIYGPALLMGLFLVFLIIFQPAGTSGFNTFVNVLFGIFFVGYFGASLAALVHSYAKAAPAERTASGLNMVVAGGVLALLPLTIASLIGIFAPRVVLPGIDFYFLTLVLIPITLAMAIMKAAAPTAPAEPMAPAM